MGYKEEFSTIEARELLEWAISAKHDGWQFVQMLAARTDEGTDLLYSLRKDDTVWNRTIKDVKPEDEVPSITDVFLSAFVFENEAHDLFGVSIKNIAIDFAGKFYDVAVDTPMSVISPELAAEKKKAAKIAAAKAAKAKKAAEAAAAKKAAEAASQQPADAVVEGGEWWPRAAMPDDMLQGAAAAGAPAPIPGEVKEGGEWWPRAAVADSTPQGAAPAAAPEPMPGEVEEGGEWWPREAPNGKEVR